MPSLTSLGQTLDERHWLGLSIWTFALGSLTQGYGRAFLRGVLLRHPLSVLSGVLAYSRFLSEQNRWGQLAVVGAADEEALWSMMAKAGPHPLVALGFCQKPGGLEHRGPACPAGRFGHRCRCLEQLDASRPTHGPRHPACQQCTVQVLGTAALRAGAALYIMTSALEIAQDLLIPALTQRRFTAIVLTLCPYSVEPMALALLTCGLKGGIAAYDQGSCLDYDQWLRADGGDKRERTSLSSEAIGKLLEGLRRVGEERQGGRRFQRQGNVYVPSQ
jgi:hypothetical protein